MKIMMRLVYITVGNEDEAKKIAKILVNERLAACVNIYKVESVYRWRGELVEDKELVLIAKTTDNKVEKIIKRVKEVHSYELPCIISFKIDKGLEEFIKWVEESTKS